jgi:hypothetical protein
MFLKDAGWDVWENNESLGGGTNVRRRKRRRKLEERELNSSRDRQLSQQSEEHVQVINKRKGKERHGWKVGT